MSTALTTYNVRFDADHAVTVLAASKADATRLACKHFSNKLRVPGWTRIPQRVAVAA